MPDEKILLEEIEALREKNKKLETEIEELKSAGEELKHEKLLMNALMDNIPDSIYFKDRECRLTRINHKMFNDLNLEDMQQVIGKTDVDLFGEEFGSKTLAEDLQLIGTGNPIVGLLESRQLDGSNFNWTMTDKVPIRNEDGEIIGLVGITREINDLMKMQQEREHERILLRTLIDNIPDYIYIKDANGKFLIANQAVFNQMGFKSQNELIGKSDFDFFRHELAEKYFTDEQAILTSGKGIYGFEGPTIDKSKENPNRWVSTTKVPFRDVRGRAIGSLGIGRDITERKEVEEKLYKVLEEFKELNKTKDKFFSIIAHDMRSPFVGLMGYSEILASEYDTLSEEEKISFIKSIDELSHNAYTLLENLLEWSRIQTGRINYNPIDLDLKKELTSTVTLLVQTAKNKDITIKCSLEDGVVVKADRNMLTTIVRNLVSNAIKFTRPNGTITVSSRQIDGQVELSVCDTGIGIKPGDILNLFKIDKSFSTKGTNNEEGSGLGLCLCKEMVLMHGGEIWAESEYGKGTTFLFTLNKVIN
jgi:two-component system, sensor histidine kinase and response regulator